MNHPTSPFVRSLAQALKKRCHVKPKDHLLLAVSGGGDSVALLRALALLAPRRKWHLKLTVAHVHHHLRDNADTATDQATEDAEFVKALAARFKLPYLQQDLDGQHLQATGNVEHNARQARYQALASMAKQVGSGIIVTAHHHDDQLETLLMRFLRGSSAQGLAAMRWSRPLAKTKGSGLFSESTKASAIFRASNQTKSPDPFVSSPDDMHLIRPMLAVSKAQVQDFLAQMNQPWREDHTNADTTRLRARLRHDVLPVLRDLQPDLPTKTQQFTTHMQQLAQLLDSATCQAYDQAVTTRSPHCITLSRPAVSSLPTIVCFELVKRILLQLACPSDALSQNSINPILTAIVNTTGRTGGLRTFKVGHHILIQLTHDRVTFTQTQKS